MPAVEHAQLPFAEQIAFFRGKLGNLIPTAVWTDVWKSQHDRAFMVAGAQKADLLADLAGVVERSIADGKSIDWFRKQFDQIVQDHGWDYTGERNWRTRTIYRTNMATSYNAGRLAQLRDPELQQLAPLWMYKHNDSVTNPRPLHLSWDGITLPPDHPWWQAHYTPNGWNCFPAGTLVRCAAKIGLKTFYTGKMVELHTRLGYRLTVTANHPILTRDGWVAADLLQEGDQLLCASGDVDAALAGIIDNKHPPACVEDLFGALAAQGFRIAQISGDDFHGDASLREPEVHVAGADRILMDVIESAAGQFIGKSRLDRALHGGIESACVSPGAAQAASVIKDAVFAQNATNSGLGDMKPPPDLRLTGKPGAIQREHLALDRIVARVGDAPGSAEQRGCLSARLDANPAQPLRITQVTARNIAQPQNAAESAAADAELFGALLKANPALVAADEIILVRQFNWSGHVYDFSTETGLIVAGGIVVSNCQCRVVAVTDAQARRQGGRLGAPPDDGLQPDGTPNGIDKGWDYMPGDTTTDDIRRLVREKAAALPAALGAALLAEMARIPDAPAAPE